MGRGSEYAQLRLWGDRQSLRSRGCRRPARRAARGRAGDRDGADRHRIRYGRVAAQPCGLQRHRRLQADARARAEREARLGWYPLCVLGPMARNVPDLCLLLSTMVSDDAARSAGDHDPRPERAQAAGFRAAGRDRPRVAARRVDARFRLRADRAPYRARCSPRRPGCSATSSPPRRRRRPIAPAPTRRSRCCARSHSWPRMHERGARHAREGRPQCPRQCRGRTALQRARRRARHEAADRALPRLAGLLRALRRDPAPAVTISPRPWSELYPGRDRRQARRAAISTGWRLPMRPPMSAIRRSRCRSGSTATACRSDCRSSGRAAGTPRCWPSRRRSRGCSRAILARRARCRTSPRWRRLNA